MKYAIVTAVGRKKAFPTVMDLLYELEQGNEGWLKGENFTVEQSGIAIFDTKDYKRCVDILYKDYQAQKAAGKKRPKIKPISIKRVLQYKEEAVEAEGF